MLEKLLEVLRAHVGDKVVVIFSILGFLLSLFWFLYTFVLGESQSARNQYYSETLAICRETADTAARLATAGDDENVGTAASRFDELYFGELILF